MTAAAPVTTGLERPAASLAYDLGPAAAALVLAVFAILSRPLIPIDETRYLTVAWEMFRSGDLLVPTLNGELYSHKPPMLFWLINLAWSLTGPNEFAGRLVPALFMPISVGLTGVLGRRLGGESLGRTASLVLLGLFAFSILGSLAMFDAMLTAAVVTALIGFVEAAQGRVWRGFLLAGLAMGAGVLIKGPAVLLHTLPIALAAPLWSPRPQIWRRWYALVLGSVVVAAAVALAWALPAARAGGPEFSRMLLWGQTAGRVASADADHASPFWLYFALLPVLTAPWCLSPSLWKAALRRSHAALPDAQPLRRLPMIAAAASFLLFTLLSAKQPHYLLPALPSFALMVASLLDGAPRARRAVATWSAVGVAVFVVGHLAIAFGALKSQDIAWAGARLRAHPAAPVAFAGAYHGEFGFTGRLRKPIEVIAPHDANAWLGAHPGGILIMPIRPDAPKDLPEATEVRRYRAIRLAVWDRGA